MSWRKDYDEVQEAEIWYQDLDALKRLPSWIKQMYCAPFPSPDLSLLKIRKGDRWGVADEKGRVLIPAQWAGVAPWPGREGLCFIWQEEEAGDDRMVGVADLQGWVLLSPCCHAVLKAEAHRFLVVRRWVEENQWRWEALWVNPLGEALERFPWRFMDQGFEIFTSGIARVMRDGKINCLDLTGRLLYATWWDGMGAFGGTKYFHREEYASPLTWVKKGDRFGFVNRQGDVIVPLILQDAKDFGRGTDGLHGFDDPDRAAVKWQGKWGYIDDQGALVIDCQWEEAAPFEGGSAQVCLQGETYLLSREGFILGKKGEREAPDPAFRYEGDQEQAQKLTESFFRPPREYRSRFWNLAWHPRMLFIYLAGRIPLLDLLEDIPESLEAAGTGAEERLYRAIGPLCREYLLEKPQCTREEKKGLDALLFAAAEEYLGEKFK